MTQTTATKTNSPTTTTTPATTTKIPLPSFSWANGSEVWNNMLEKDATYARLRSEKILERHPSLVDSYRTILFDWLSEVSHECKFHRETYHLALDLVDRYLAAQTNISKLQLQLIGITCLFLAAKYEEIRPPTVQEFADLTDGACRPEDIVDHEVIILSAINWEITPITPNSWLNIYMQILVNLDDKCPDGENKQINSNKHHQQQLRKNDSFILPTQNGILRYNHKRIASVIDLALLHIESLRFTWSKLAAAALYHFTSEKTVQLCTGYRYLDIYDCIHWLEPFVETIKDIREPVFIAACKGNETDCTQMHTHIATASLLENVSTRATTLKRKACVLDEDIESPVKQTQQHLSTTVLLTPPSSTRKSRRIH